MHCYNMLLSRAQINTLHIEISLDISRKQREEENKKKACINCLDNNAFESK